MVEITKFCSQLSTVIVKYCSGVTHKFMLVSVYEGCSFNMQMIAIAKTVMAVE